MTLRLLDEAKEELRESACWYVVKRDGLGDDFVAAVERGLELIEAHPRRFKRIETDDSNGEVRRFLLKRFPYQVVYEISRDEITFVAIAHGKRKPGYWRDRS